MEGYNSTYDTSTNYIISCDSQCSYSNEVFLNIPYISLYFFDSYIVFLIIIMCFVDDSLKNCLLPTLAANDGLSVSDWLAWFKCYDKTKPLAIIHFTDFRYE